MPRRGANRGVHGPRPRQSSIRRRRRVGGFNPLQISGLQAWYKADSIGGVADGGTIATWADSSGNGANLAQATEAKKPTFQTGEINGLPVVQYADAGDEMASTIAGTAQPFTIFAVVEFQTDSDGQAQDIASDATGNWRFGMRNSGTEWRMYAGLDVTGGGAVISPEVPYVVTALFNGASSKLRSNGTERISTDAGATALGTAFYVMGESRSVADTTQVGEVIVYAGDKTADFGAVERYLGARWGITVS